MGAESAILEMGLLQREASDYGGTLTYAGRSFPCSTGVIGFGARFVAGGFSPNAEVPIVVRKSCLDPTIVFATGQTLTLTDADGVDHALKIAGEGIKDCIFCWELTCNDVNQGA